VATGTIIRASHLTELETAINLERNDGTRRYNAIPPSCSGDCALYTTRACSSNAFSPYAFSGSRAIGNVISAGHWDAVKTANNEVRTNSGFGGLIANNFIAGAIIYATYIQDLQTKINQSRNVCICDSHCSCNPFNCGCNGECPSDDYYYYYYYV
jgi:hypothetical protein